MVSAYADPTLRNSATDSHTFGAIAKVNPTVMQSNSFSLGLPPISYLGNVSTIDVIPMIGMH